MVYSKWTVWCHGPWGQIQSFCIICVYICIYIVFNCVCLPIHLSVGTRTWCRLEVSGQLQVAISCLRQALGPLNQGSLQEQCSLPPDEPSLQPSLCIFFRASAPYTTGVSSCWVQIKSSQQRDGSELLRDARPATDENIANMWPTTH